MSSGPIVVGPPPVSFTQTGSGLSTVTIEQLLEDVSLALLEPIVLTVLGTNVVAGNGVSVTPGSMRGIYPAALLVVGGFGDPQEVITVISTTSTGFTANFQNNHPAYDPLVGATFPSGFPDHQLFTQNEILGYLTDVHNDFLLKTKCVFEVTGSLPGTPANIPVVVNQRFFAQPAQAIRVERLARIITGTPTPPPPAILDLYETTQTDLDTENYAWSADSDIPKRWFRDQIDTSQLGLQPLPNIGGITLEAWYSKRGPAGVLTLLSTLLVPDVMSHYIKYGILSRCWSKDGEVRDPLRSDYCKKRYEFGVVLVNRFMEGIGLSAGASGQKYNPMAIPASA